MNDAVLVTDMGHCVYAETSLRVYLSVQRLQIFSKFCDTIAFADFNAKALLLSHIGGKAAEAFAATAAHSHQQGIAAGLHQDPVNAADMQNSIPASAQSQNAQMCTWPL